MPSRSPTSSLLSSSPAHSGTWTRSLLTPRNRSRIVLGSVFLIALFFFLTSIFPPEGFTSSWSEEEIARMKMLGRRRAAQVVGRERQGRQEVTPAEGGRGIWQKHFGGSITRPLPSFDSNPTSPTMYDSHPSEKDHLSLRTDGVVQTNVAASTRGFTAFEHIYLKDGIWYIVNSNASGSIPPIHHMHVGFVPKPNELDLSPQQLARHVRLITPEEAGQFLGTMGPEGNVGIVKGTTWVWKENFFLAHYGHFAMELFFGSWKISTLAWPHSTPSPMRLFFSLFNEKEWRDSPGLNAFTLRSAFPSLSFLTAVDFASFTNSSLPLVFENVVLVDRQAAKLAKENREANKMVAELGAVHQAQSEVRRRGWWEPVRRNVVRAVGGRVQVERKPVVVTYVSRQQAVHRRLKEEDHEKLVVGLKTMEKRRGSEEVRVDVVTWEDMTPAEQILQASKTTIFLSLHGNGLSHQLWAPQLPLSTTIEMLYPNGWARDFQLPASMLGRRHFAFWDDVILRGEEMEPDMRFPDGFHEHSTPVKAEAVVDLIEMVLDGREPPQHKARFGETGWAHETFP